MNMFRFLIIIMITASALQMYAMSALQKKQAEIAKKQLEKAQIQVAQIREIAHQLGIPRLIILFDPKNSEGYVKGDCSYLTKTSAALQHMLPNALNSDIPIIMSYWLLQFSTTCALQDKKKGWHVYITPNNSMAVLIPNKMEVFRNDNDTNTLLYKPNKDEKTKGHIKLLFWENKPISERKTISMTFSFAPSFGTSEPDGLLLSPGELLLGIKVNKLTYLGTLDTLSNLEDKSSSDNLETSLKDILITRIDLRKAKINDDPLNRWDIYLQGHGGARESIAGMPKGQFGELLDFLNTKINTRSFFYLTCFSGGQNLNTPYTYDTHGITRSKDFNFLLITANMLETPTHSKSISSFDDFFGWLHLYITQGKEFPKSLMEAVSAIAPATLEQFFNIPAVRFPHTEWFKMAEAEPEKKSKKEQLLIKDQFLINDRLIMFTINQGKTEIIIPKNVTKIVVESQYIPIPIVIESKSFPYIIPTNNADHFFNEIRAPNATFVSQDFSSLVNRLEILVIKMHNFSKSFYIGKLTIKVGNKKMKDANSAESELLWPDLVTFTNVFLIPSSKTYAVRYGNSNWFYEDKVWQPNGIEPMQVLDWVANIYEKSQLPLIVEYIKFKDMPKELTAWKETLSPPQKAWFDQWIKQQTLIEEQSRSPRAASR